MTEQRAVIQSAAGGLYAIFMVVLGIALPMGYFLKDGVKDDALYFKVFHIYLYSVSIIFLTYVHLSMNHIKRKKDSSCTPNMTNGKKKSRGENGTPHINTGYMEGEESTTDNDTGIQNQTAAVRLPPTDEEDEHYEGPLYAHAAEGVNYFLRLGLIGFAFVSILQDGFYLMQFWVDDETADASVDCFGYELIVMICLRIIFILQQAMFIFKNHELILDYNPCVMKLGYLHIIATNLCVWCLTVTVEATETFTHNAHITHVRDDMKSNTTGHEDESSSHDIHKRAAVEEDTENGEHGSDYYTATTCLHYDTIANNSAPYLLPFLIEYSLIAAAIIYKLYTNVGAEIDKDDMNNDELLLEEESKKVVKKTDACHKAHTGLLAGLLVFIVTTVIVTVALITIELDGVSQTATMVETATYTDITLNALSLLVVLTAHIRMRKLRFVNELESELDQNLLIIALTGYYILIVFIVAGTADEFSESDVAKRILFGRVLTFVQISVQVLFIVDGLRRRPVTPEDIRDKPGRSLVTFLLLCNLSMWVINSFMIKSITYSDILKDFYGDLAWFIIVNMCTPLSIFFRFHSSVCISDIWLIAYKKHEVNHCQITRKSSVSQNLF